MATRKTRNENQAVDREGMEKLSGATMPESLPAEAAVLGSMVLNPECVGSVIEKLEVSSFYRHEHQMIYEAIVSLYDRNRAEGLDGILLREELEKRKQLDEIGGTKYLGQVIESVATPANFEYYTNIVREKWLLRELVIAAQDIQNLAFDGDGEVSEKLDRAEQKIFAITNKKISNSAASINDLVAEVYEMIEQRDGKLLTGLGTGYFELDDMTCGLQKGEMIIIAGRPSMGKTSFALNIAEYMAVKEEVPIALFSLEMGKHQLAERFLCSNSQVDSQAVRKGNLQPNDYHSLAEAMTRLSKAPIYIDDSSGISPLELRAKARRLKSRYDIQCVIIDYLQLMSAGARSESRQQEITMISRYIKSLARELNVPVLILSQLNRAAESREDHRPRMSDLRESGSIEQDADVIMMLHREEYYKKNEPDFTPSNTAEVIIAKQRNGPTGTVKLMFREQLTRFENYAGNVAEPF